MSPYALSVLLALVSAVAYAVGAVLQERVAATDRTGLYAPVRQSAWWVANLLNGFGALLHVGALAYGPLSLVQPMGALTIVFALPIAAVFVRRRAGAMAWRGALMATAGLAALLSLTGAAHAGGLSGGDQLLVAGASLAGTAVLFAAARAVRPPVLRSVLLAASAGISFGIASVFIKSLAVGWSSFGLAGQWQAVPVIVAFATLGLLLSQASYRGAGLTAPLATVTVVNPVVASAVGLTLFGESFRYGTTGVLLAAGAALLAATGLVLLTAGHAQPDRAERPDEDLVRRDAGEALSVERLPRVPVRRGPGRDQTVTPPALR
ncbi:DMT family transporter [Streptomyces sp. NPDC004111]|uniref:DMT family transporter n=1 Tax=Streptomyces sp. NPDC004111 TaxID=3364690 RepID=UPI003674153E